MVPPPAEHYTRVIHTPTGDNPATELDVVSLPDQDSARVASGILLVELTLTLMDLTLMDLRLGGLQVRQQLNFFLSWPCAPALHG